MEILKMDDPRFSEPGEMDVVIDRNMVLRFKEAETRLSSQLLLDDKQKEGIKKAANFFLWQAFSALKDGKPKSKVMEKYNMALELLANAGLEMDSTQEWEQVNDIIRSMRAEEDMIEFLKLQADDKKKQIDLLFKKISESFSLSSSEMKEIKEEIRGLREALSTRKTESSTLKVFIVTLSILSVMIFIIVVSSVIISQAIMRVDIGSRFSIPSATVPAPPSETPR